MSEAKRTLVGKISWIKAGYKNYYAEVRWMPEDVNELKKDWSHEQCESWLMKNEKHIKESITELGWDVIKTLLP